MMQAYDNLGAVSQGQIVQRLNNSINYGGALANGETPEAVETAQVEPEDISLVVPVTNNSEAVAERVVVAEDERFEIENIAFGNEPELQQAIELPETQSITNPENILQENTTEPVAAHTEHEPEHVAHPADYGDNFAPVTETPAEDHRAEMLRPVFDEEEINEWHVPGAEAPETQAEEDAPIEENWIWGDLITGTPEKEKAAAAAANVFEEKVIESPEHETALPGEAEPEAVTGDEKAQTWSPFFEEDIIELPEESEEVTDEDVIEEYVPSAASKDIDDAVYDEIVGIESIHLEPAKVSSEHDIIQTGTAADAAEGKAESTDSHDDLSELISAGLAGSDYFVFERAESPVDQQEPPHPGAFVEEYTEAKEQAAEQNVTEAEPAISKYHDDKMPYTFMWWLDKTRREHAGVYQPFKLDTTQAIRHQAADTLQQQYYENIFHITTVAELDTDASEQTVEFDMKNKEDRIIKKFIAAEPHIGTPSSDKLGNENKAKKSSEDQYELVTETLARIYTDQMLYHKAINIYKKLMLKFPEKSRYFADQIELLERKIN